MSLASACHEAIDDLNHGANSWYPGNFVAVAGKISNNVNSLCIPKFSGIGIDLKNDWNSRPESTVLANIHIDNMDFDPSTTVHYVQRGVIGDGQTEFRRHSLEEIAEILLGPEDADAESYLDLDENKSFPLSERSLNPSEEAYNFFDISCKTLISQTQKPVPSIVAHTNESSDNCRGQENRGNMQNDIQSKVKSCSPRMPCRIQRDAEKMECQKVDLKLLLIDSAKIIANGCTADHLIAELKNAVDIFGDPMERLGAYMMEGLVARLQKSGGRIYKSLTCMEPTGHELLSSMRTFYGMCPCFRFSYTAVNGAIAEAFKGKDRVHIIDFQIAQGGQWPNLIKSVAKRSGGAPHVRITAVDDHLSRYARGQGLQIVGERLAALAEKCHVPFEFHELNSFPTDINADMLEIRPGEAVAVNFPLLLHHMPDESVSTENHRDRLLRMVKSFNPDVVTIVEQEANTNTSPFLPRFTETLQFYFAMFDSLDANLPRDSKERVHVEQHCLARDIVNIIGCEGAERVERHEPFKKWKSRLTMAGFKPYPLSSTVNSTVKFLLKSYDSSYTLVERDEALFLGWKDRELFAASAWR